MIHTASFTPRPLVLGTLCGKLESARKLEIAGSSMEDDQDEELARTALSCHLSMGLLCHQMPDTWSSEDCSDRRWEMMC